MRHHGRSQDLPEATTAPQRQHDCCHCRKCISYALCADPCPRAGSRVPVADPTSTQQASFYADVSSATITVELYTTKAQMVRVQLWSSTFSNADRWHHCWTRSPGGSGAWRGRGGWAAAWCPGSHQCCRRVTSDADALRILITAVAAALLRTQTPAYLYCGRSCMHMQHPTQSSAEHRAYIRSCSRGDVTRSGSNLLDCLSGASKWLCFEHNTGLS